MHRVSIGAGGGGMSEGMEERIGVERMTLACWLDERVRTDGELDFWMAFHESLVERMGG